MHRNFLNALLYVLVPSAFFGYYALFGTYRPGIDLAGGTTLVYELDLEKSKEMLKESAAATTTDAAGLNTEQMQQLCEALKRRIDPTDTKNVIIRPIGGTRVEITLPFVPKKGGGEETAGNEDFVQEVKNIVSKVGVLEFRILANEVDDMEGILAAEAAILKQTPQEAMAAAKAGKVPPPPEGKFRVKVNEIDVDDVVYEWREIGKEERKSLGLSGEPNPRRMNMYDTLAATRGKTYRYSNNGSGKDGKQQSTSMLLFSRDCIVENPSKEDQDKKVEYFMLTRVSDRDRVRVGDGNTLRAEARNPQGEWVVAFEFTSGADQFTRMTDRNRPTGSTYRYMAVLLDDKIRTAPTLNSKLPGGGEISGNMTKATVDEIVKILKSGALSAQLKPNPVSENFTGPTLGKEAREKGLWSVGVAFGAVLLFMVYYYRFAGLVACVALFLNLLLTVGFMNWANAAYTLTGLAGIVLMLGMAVDANVLIYERVKEERVKGAALAAALRAGYDRALPTIIDTHLTSIFTSIVLYTFGNDNLKGFAISLAVGLVISLGTSIYVTRVIFDYFLAKRWLTDLRMLSLFSRPNIDFMAIRRQMLTLTAILTVLGLGLFLFRGELGLNIDFRGGTAYGGRLAQPLALSDFQKLVSEDAQKGKLGVKEVVKIEAKAGDGDGSEQIVNERLYEIYYNDGSKVVVSLANDPAGPGKSDEENKAALKERAGVLPDVSVEQVASSRDDFSGGGTRSFVLRTTERESNLVQVSLDRLLRTADGKPMIDATAMTIQVTGPKTAVLTFTQPTSLNYVASQLKQQFLLDYKTPAVGEPFKLIGIPDSKETDEAKKAEDIRKQRSSGKYLKMELDVTSNPTFKDSDAKSLTEILTKAKGTFDSRPSPERLETFDAALAKDTQARASYAILASWIAILFYLWFRFGSWTFGLAAVLCLVHDLCFTLGAIALCHYLHLVPGLGTVLQIYDFKIDLNAVAALLTLVGYSVSDTIVVFDRIREVRGKNPLLTVKMINDSVNQTLSRTILASLTVFLVAIVLYFFGGENVHLFAFVMIIGVLVGTYSSIYIAAPLLLIFGEGQPKPEVKKVEKETVAV